MIVSFIFLLFVKPLVLILLFYFSALDHQVKVEFKWFALIGRSRSYTWKSIFEGSHLKINLFEGTWSFFFWDKILYLHQFKKFLVTLFFFFGLHQSLIQILPHFIPLLIGWLALIWEISLSENYTRHTWQGAGFSVTRHFAKGLDRFFIICASILNLYHTLIV